MATSAPWEARLEVGKRWAPAEVEAFRFEVEEFRFEVEEFRFEVEVFRFEVEAFRFEVHLMVGSGKGELVSPHPGFAGV